MASYIPDQYTEHGYIAERRNLHGALRFQFRPMLLDERSLFSQANIQNKPREQNRNIAKLLAEKIVCWDLKDAGKKDAPLAITIDNMLRLQPALFDRLFGIIMGNDAFDDDPDLPEPAKTFDEATEAKN
jgi:hypothetical protein